MYYTNQELSIAYATSYYMCNSDLDANAIFTPKKARKVSKFK